ncbi:biopolymer transporter ExbD [Acuticoccus mangrovi]|uniref:Biopolymer transporter ExbD n=1 Tax=Acuticoccus mangrovi TaxID=2796142 RepID=A0A934MFZ6_9HYPH|nr:biopolymer transporter ExbD [Acuticoccus mangrovi]MBJ3776008.1 biopolymer transporter ExbD [Acuticoccus mangrovi]
MSRRRPLAAPKSRRAAPESTIALINVVFLLLVFFLVAGTLSAPRDPNVELATAERFDATPLAPQAIYIAADGTMRVAGEIVAPEEALATIAALPDPGDTVVIVPDRNLEAATLLALLPRLHGTPDRPFRLIVRRPAAGEARR